MIRARATALVLSFFALSCAGPAARYAPPPPELGARSSSWRTLESSHFVVDTDVTSDASEIPVELERIYDAFATVLFPASSDRAPPPRVRVIVLADREEYEPFGPHGSAAFSSDRLPLDVEPEPVVVMYGGVSRLALEVFEHELTHQLVSRAMGPLPAWLSEGLAKFYETARVERDRVVVGDPPRVRVASPLPTIEALRHMSREEFYAAREGVAVEATHYAAAFFLVHLCNTGPADVRAAFDRFLDLLARGSGQDEAWASAFAAVDMQKLEEDYATYTRRPGFTARAAPYRAAVIAGATSARAMSEAEVHALRAKLFGATAGARSAEAELLAARALAPSWVEPRLLMGRLRAEQRRFTEAETELGAALAIAPSDPRARYAYEELALRRALGDHRDLAALSDGMNQLGNIARTADELELVAQYYVARKKPLLGIPYAKRAIRVRPTCYGCYGTLGALLLQNDEIDEAVAALERAIALMPERATAPGFTKLLEEARDRQRLRRPREN